MWYLGTKEHGTTDMVEIGDSAEARGANILCTPWMVKPLDVATSSPGNESAVFNLKGHETLLSRSTSLFCLFVCYSQHLFPTSQGSAPSDFHATR